MKSGSEEKMNRQKNLAYVQPSEVAYFPTTRPLSLSHPNQNLSSPFENSTTKETFTNSRPLPREREIALKSLEYLRTLEDNFDGKGTEIPLKETLDTATRFIIRSFGKMYPTSIYPGIDRTLSLAYERSDIEGVLYITVEYNKIYISKLKREGGVERYGEYNIPLEGVYLSAEIRSVLPAYR